MSDPPWLGVGTALEDPDGKRWMIYEVEYEFVKIEDPEAGTYRLKLDDLVQWVERGDWEVIG